MGRLGVAIFVVMVFPVFWMISTAFKPDDQINSLTPTWFSLQPTLHHFRDAMHQPFFWNDVVNTLIIVGVTVAISMTLAFLAAVAVAKYRFTGRKLFIVIVIGDPDDSRRRADHPALRRAGELPPGQRAERRDHRLHLRACCRSRVWTLRGFILGIPKDLEEAAMVDGSTRLGAFVRILLPLVAPGLVATSVFAFITTWNEYIFARILLNDQSKQTVTVWLSYFLGTSRHTDWGALMAGSTLIAIPVIIFFLLVQRKIAFGLTAGAVRG